MNDELVKRLRDIASWDWNGMDGEYVERAVKEAADAIEELSMKLHGDEAAIAGMKREIERMVVAGKPRWIPVEERLPEDIGEEVLVCNEDYGVSELGFVTVATYGDSGWLDCWERKTYITAVTNWMPLPQPPKEGVSMEEVKIIKGCFGMLFVGLNDGTRLPIKVDKNGHLYVEEYDGIYPAEEGE